MCTLWTYQSRSLKIRLLFLLGQIFCDFSNSRIEFDENMSIRATSEFSVLFGTIRPKNLKKSCCAGSTKEFQVSFAPMQRLKGLYLAGMRFVYFSPLFSNSNKYILKEKFIFLQGKDYLQRLHLHQKILEVNDRQVALFLLMGPKFWKIISSRFGFYETMAWRPTVISKFQ